MSLSRRHTPVRVLFALLVLMIGASALVWGACSVNDDTRVEGLPNPTDAPDEPSPTMSSPTPSASSTPSPSSVLMDAVCSGVSRVDDAGRITTPDITEASGLVASWVNDDTWWVTNDSGDSARIFAVATHGTLLATVTLDGAVARDWESLAIGPPMDGLDPSVYVGDTGNNLMRTDKAATSRTTMRVYRFVEPVIDRDAAPQQLRRRVETLTFRFPDGPHDVEAMLVDPVSGDLLFVTKDWARTGVSGVYRAPGSAGGSTTTLERVGEVPLEQGTLVTGADVTRDGALVAVRSYGAVDLYRRPAGQPVWAAFSTTPCSGPSPGELQGESIAFGPDGGSYVTVAEGMNPVLHLTVP